MQGIFKRGRRFGVLLALVAIPSCAEQAEQGPAAGPRAYVTNEMSGDLTIIDVGARRVVGRVPLGKRPRGIVPSPNGRLLYIALSGSPIAGPGVDESKLPPADKSADGIAEFDVETERVLRVLRGISDPETVAVSPDGSRLYVASEDTGQMVAMDARSGGIVGKVEIGGEPEGGAVSPDGRFVVATSEEDSTAAVIEADGPRGDFHRHLRHDRPGRRAGSPEPGYTRGHGPRSCRRAALGSRGNP
jgi:YVTN family beta-propeller protein